MSLWIKIVYTLFVCVLVPVYAIQYPLTNFLWFSDIALITSVLALWLKSSLLASMMALAVLLPEIVWNVSFFSRLILGADPIGLSAYMFDPRRPLYLRALSLFHVVIPAVLIWMVYQFGYDRRAWFVQTIVALVVLPLSYFWTKPADNVNWVYGLGNKPQQYFPPLVYLGLLMILFPLVVYLPTHFVLTKFFTRAAITGN